jgi:hypothetical protein
MWQECEDSRQALADTPAKLLDDTRVDPEKPPPPPEPTEWVYTWLQGHGLQQYGRNFIGEDLTTVRASPWFRDL